MLIRNTAPDNINTTIREYSIMRNCSPVLFEIVFLSYINSSNINSLGDECCLTCTFLGKNALSVSITALTTNKKILNVWVNVVTLNNPPYIPIPLSNDFKNRLFSANKLVEVNAIITTLENNIDLSRLDVRAFESNKKINKDINIKTGIYIPV